MSATPPHPTAGEIAADLGPLLADDQVVELRAVRVPDGRRTATWSGYFDPDHRRHLADAAARLARTAGAVYVTLNPLVPDALARRANRVDRAGDTPSAGVDVVARRRWLDIDIDPIRPSGISATDEEKAAAAALAGRVRAFLTDRGWPDPLVFDSGNGVHNLYRVDRPTADDAVRRCLAALADRFPDGGVVDRGVYAANLLFKVPGTWSRKGDSRPDRPHRRCRWAAIPDRLAVVPDALLEGLAAEADPPPAAAPSAGGDGPRERTGGHRLDVPRWLGDRGVAFAVAPRPTGDGRTKFLLAACPFDPDHAAGDAAVFQAADGALSAKCFHASCSGRGWRAFKAALGPPDPHHFDPPLRPRGSGGRVPPTGPAAVGPGANQFLPMAWHDPARLADAVLDRMTVRFLGKTAFVYDGGRYAATGDEALAAAVRRIVEGEAADEFRRRQAGPRPPALAPAVTGRMIADTLGALRARVQLPDGTAPGGIAVPVAGGWRVDPDPPPVLAVANGLLDLGSVRAGDAGRGTARLLAHTPDRFHLAALPGRFDPHAPPPARWLAFLADAFPDDPERIAVLQEVFGACLHPALGWKHVTALVGDGDNGKSVVLAALRALLGPANVAAVELAQLGQSRFAAFPLLGKLANLAGDEAAFDSADEGRLRQLTGGDLCPFEQKGKTPLFARNTAKLVFSCNTLPTFADRTEAIWRRLIPVPFDRRVPADRQDPALVTDAPWRAEWGGLLNWALGGLARYVVRGRRTTCPAVERLLETHRLDSNPARAFLVECCRLAAGAVTPTAVLYARYRNWCEANGYRFPLTSRSFGREVARQFPDARSQGTHRDGQAVRGWYGLELDGAD